MMQMKKNEELENLFNKVNIKNNKQSFLKKFLNFFKVSKTIQEKNSASNTVKNIELVKQSTLPTPVAKELTPLEKKFDDFLHINKYGILLKMLENGYEMTPEQNKKINSYIENYLYNNLNGLKVENLYEIESFLHLGIKISDETLKNVCSYLFVDNNPKNKINYNFFKNNNKDISEVLNQKELNIFLKNKEPTQAKKLDVLTNQIREFINNNDIPLIYINKIFSSVEIKANQPSIHTKFELTYSEMDLFNTVLLGENSKQILNRIHFDDFVQIMTYCKNFHNENESMLNQQMTSEEEHYYLHNNHFDFYFPEEEDYETSYTKKYLKVSSAKLYNTLSNYFDYYEKNINEVLETVKQEYSSEYIEKMTQLAIQTNAYKKNLKDLPESTIVLLSQINEVYKSINNTTSNIDKEKIYNLFEKRLPEILEKYLSIDESYRLTLRNTEGKNAEQLMIESLENIKIAFNNTWEEINTDKLTDLSIKNRYTKKMI